MREGVLRTPSLPIPIIKRFLQEECMMAMVYCGHRRLLDYCEEFVPLVIPEVQTSPDLGIAHFPCGLCSRSFSSVQARQGHHWKFHGRFSEERKLVHGSTCLACGQCFWTAQRMQQHLRYSRRYGAGGCLAQLRKFFEPLQVPEAVHVPFALRDHHRLPKCTTPGPYTKPDYPLWERRVHAQMLEWRQEWEALGLSLTPDHELHDRVRACLSETTEQWLHSLPPDFVVTTSPSELDDRWITALWQLTGDVLTEEVLWAFVEWGESDLYSLMDGLSNVDARQELETMFLHVAEQLPVYNLLARKRQLLHWLNHAPPDEVDVLPEVQPDTRRKRALEPIPSSLERQTDVLHLQIGRAHV